MEKKTIFSIIIVFLMVASIFGATLESMGATNKLEYGDHTFYIVNQQYRTSINGKDYSFNFFPGDIEYILIPDEVKTLLDKPVLALTYEPSSNLSEAMGAVHYYLEQQLQDAKVLERSLTNNTGTDLTQKSCKDATDSQPVIELLLANQSSMQANGNCVIVSALDQYDLFQQTERMAYHLP